MTLPTCYSWSPVGERLTVPAEAPQGRRVNAIGAYFSHGPHEGELHSACWGKLPKRGRKRQTIAERAERHGLRADEVGVIDSEHFLAFVWRIAGRPEGAPAGWRRERPLWIALDNYTVHKSAVVREAVPALEAAGVRFWYLPSYSPELSAIEPIWHALKHRDLRWRSFEQLGQLKRAVESALAEKATALRAPNVTTDHFLPLAA
jgi:DDE superfamily endonuclease